MITMTMPQFKAGFFDRAKVINAVSKAERKVLSKTGAFVRQRARTSIRKRKGISKPGSPPFSHVGLLRRGILFAWDDASRTVVIGPALLRPTSRVPHVLEYGGTSLIESFGKRKPAKVRARPFMGPALQAELSQMPEAWRNSVTVR